MTKETTTELSEVVTRFTGKRILVVGDIMIDRYVFGKVERLNPEAPVPILNAKSEIRSTGGAGNTAKNAAALGAITTLISVTGEDKSAADIVTCAYDEGYRAVLVRNAGRPTTEKRRYNMASQQMLRVDYEETSDVSEEIESMIVAAIKEEAAQTDAIIVSDYAKGVITRKVAEAVMKSVVTHAIPVMADVKPSHIDYFVGATLISPNRKEAHEYLGLNQHFRGGQPMEELARRLKSSFDVGVFLTLSEGGIYVLTSQTNGLHVRQRHRIEVADTSGCGDTAAVALTLAKLVGATDSQAAEIGNAAGAVIASKIGAVALTQSELMEILIHS
jgi:rfaE bifunctional protein kinase chain/domain